MNNIIVIRKLMLSRLNEFDTTQTLMFILKLNRHIITSVIDNINKLRYLLSIIRLINMLLYSLLFEYEQEKMK